MATPAQSPGRVRKDQLRNRARLIESGRKLFRSPAGLDATVSDVSAEAGLGLTSFYRHFASKDAFLEALLDDLSAGGREVAARAARCSDPWDAFRLLFAEGCALDAGDLALFNRIADSSAQLADRARQHTVGIIGDALAREQRAGRVRADVTVDEVATLMHMASYPFRAGERLRYVDLLLDGLRVPGDRGAPGVSRFAQA